VNLNNLKQLYVWQTGVTERGVEKLQKALPSLRIIRGVDLDKVAAQAKKPKPDPGPADRFMDPVIPAGPNRARTPVPRLIPRLIPMPPSIPQWALTIVQSYTINWAGPCGFVTVSPCRCSDHLAGDQLIFIRPVFGA
jgi:hypothetical protein